jgi:hypothetical protein
MSGNSSRRNDNALATPERNNMLTDETPTNLKRDAGDGSRQRSFLLNKQSTPVSN